MAKVENNNDLKINGEDKAAKILKQVEYYFGDINLPRDKFLLTEMKLDNGWIPLTTMLKFNRLASISSDMDELTEALKKSDLIEVDESKFSIRRSIAYPLPDNTVEYWLGVKRRTVYVKGFPQTATIDELLTFMHQHGQIENVLMRKTKGEPRVFKGSIFATFKTVEEAEKFAKSEEALTYNDLPLIKLMQEAYWSNKNKESKEKKQAQKLIKQAKREQVDKEQKESISAAHFVKGIVLKVQGLPENCSINELKSYFGEFGEVAYVKAEETVFVRFNSSEENYAQTSWDKAVQAGENGSAVFEKDGKKYILTAQPLEGDEENQYWVDFNNQKLRAAERFDKRGSGKKGKNRKRRLETNEINGEIKKPKHIVFENENDGEKVNENGDEKVNENGDEKVDENGDDSKPNGLAETN